MLDAIQHLFKHMYWSDERVLEELRGPGGGEDTTRLFAHVLAAEHVWYTRLQGEDSSYLEIWPDFDLETCASRAEQLKALYRTYLRRATDKSLAEAITYRDSRGQEHESLVSDVLLQVATHGVYHRGQIATRVRAAGGKPVSIDFIAFCRENG